MFGGISREGAVTATPAISHGSPIPHVQAPGPGTGAERIELERLTDELDLAVRSAERLFMDAAKDLTTRYQFVVIREAAAQAITSISRSGDIIVIAEPATPIGHATQQFSWLLNAAFQSAAAVMLVPARLARVTGPVVAIAIKPDDPSIRAAAAIAIAAKEDLVIVHAHEGKSRRS